MPAPVALVTGGAKRIGGAIVRALHADGYRSLPALQWCWVAGAMKVPWNFLPAKGVDPLPVIRKGSSRTTPPPNTHTYTHIHTHTHTYTHIHTQTHTHTCVHTQFGPLSGSERRAEFDEVWCTCAFLAASSSDTTRIKHRADTVDILNGDLTRTDEVPVYMSVSVTSSRTHPPQPPTHMSTQTYAGTCTRGTFTIPLGSNGFAGTLSCLVRHLPPRTSQVASSFNPSPHPPPRSGQQCIVLLPDALGCGHRSGLGQPDGHQRQGKK